MNITELRYLVAIMECGSVSAAAKRLYIRLPSRNCPQYAKVINLLGIFDGNMPVILYLEDTKQKLAAPRRLYTSGHPNIATK